jgi:uncharacterized protein
LGGDIAQAIGLLVSAVAVLGIVGFLSMWVHHADRERVKVAPTMGLYIVFGAFAFFVFLYGLGSAYRDYREDVSIASSSLLAIIVGVIGALGLVPQLRRLVTKIVPFDPNSKTDMIGFVLLGWLAALSAFALFVADSDVESVGYLELIIQNAALIALAFIAVGVGFERTRAAALERLGLRLPTARQVGIGLGMVVVAFVISAVSSGLVSLLQPDLYDEINENLREMTSQFDTAWGALILGIMSGAGEETLFRGAVQPRFGIIFTAIIFALLHAQYGASFVTLGVFGVGILFGLERKYFNTTTAIITHATYNTIAVLISLLQ